MGCVLSSQYSPFFYIIPEKYNPSLKSNNYAVRTKTKSDVGQNSEKEDVKVYSWDARKTSNPVDYMLENKNGETIVKLPGSLNGTQYIIQNLENCVVYLLDNIAQLSVDDCKNCKFFVGPSKGSVFIRDCSDCSFAIVCQQFRTRDCNRITSFMSCATQPIIESSTQMKFGCISVRYSQLNEQLKVANLSQFNNNWNNIHDFTPVPGEPNFSLLSKDFSLEDFIPANISTIDEGARNRLGLSFSKNDSVIPYTVGVSYRPLNQSALLVVFVADSTPAGLLRQESDANRVLTDIKSKYPDLVLVQTKKYNLSELSSESVFGSKNYNQHLMKGPIIGLEFNGVKSIMKCNEVVRNLHTELIYVSAESPNLSHQIDNFYNFAEMVMSI